MYNKRITPKIGKMDIISIPILNPTCSGVKETVLPNTFAHSIRAILSTRIPSVCGAIDAPKSPPAAISAYAATPAAGIFSSIKIKVPGQSIAVQIPNATQEIRDITGNGEIATTM